MSNIIDINNVIDTDAVKHEYRNPSKDPSKPTGISHNMGYMVVTGTTIISGQRTADVTIKPLVGDTVRAFGTSDDFEDSILIYGMPYVSGQQVFTPFTPHVFTKAAVVPQSETAVLPAKIANENSFGCYEASAVRQGTEGLGVQFALFTPALESGQPVLYGYFCWDPTITVLG